MNPLPIKAGRATIRKSNTDQLQGAYHITTMVHQLPNLTSGVNNWVERTPPTLLEQEHGRIQQDTDVCFGQLEVMNLEQNGTIAVMVNGTMDHYLVVAFKLTVLTLPALPAIKQMMKMEKFNFDLNHMYLFNENKHTIDLKKKVSLLLFNRSL